MTTTTAMLAPAVPVGAVFVHDGRRYTLTRQHRAPKGRALIGWRRDGGGVGMQELADTDRLDVVELPAATPQPAPAPAPVEVAPAEQHPELAIPVSVPGPLADFILVPVRADRLAAASPAGAELVDALRTTAARPAGKGLVYRLHVTRHAAVEAMAAAGDLIAMAMGAPDVASAAARRFWNRYPELR